MAELAFYPGVALLYFFGVMRASKEDKVELDDRASLNVFLLFVLAQPLCLVIGGYTGMATYLLTAGVSYHWLPWRREVRAGDRSQVKKDKRKKTEYFISEVNHKHSRSIDCVSMDNSLAC